MRSNASRNAQETEQIQAADPAAGDSRHCLCLPPPSPLHNHEITTKKQHCTYQRLG